MQKRQWLHEMVRKSGNDYMKWHAKAAMATRNGMQKQQWLHKMIRKSGNDYVKWHAKVAMAT